VSFVSFVVHFLLLASFVSFVVHLLPNG